MAKIKLIRKVVYQVVREQQVWEAKRPGAPYTREVLVAQFEYAHFAQQFMRSLKK